jgi:hypothetical protein
MKNAFKSTSVTIWDFDFYSYFYLSFFLILMNTSSLDHTLFSGNRQKLFSEQITQASASKD